MGGNTTLYIVWLFIFNISTAGNDKGAHSGLLVSNIFFKIFFRLKNVYSFLTLFRRHRFCILFYVLSFSYRISFLHHNIPFEHVFVSLLFHRSFLKIIYLCYIVHIILSTVHYDLSFLFDIYIFYIIFSTSYLLEGCRVALHTIFKQFFIVPTPRPWFLCLEITVRIGSLCGCKMKTGQAGWGKHRNSNALYHSYLHNPQANETKRGYTLYNYTVHAKPNI